MFEELRVTQNESHYFRNAVIGAFAVSSVLGSAKLLHEHYVRTHAAEDASATDILRYYGQKAMEFGTTLYGHASEIHTSVKDFLNPNETEQNPQSLYEAVTEKEAQSLLARTEIHGDKFYERKLEVDDFTDAGLVPKYKVKVDDKEIVFSDTYEIPEQRRAVVGYLRNQEGRVVARSYYLSQSQGLWRYLPSYDEYNGWFDKGHHEDGLNLPIAAQKALSDIALTDPQEVKQRDLIFFGTARDLKTGGITYRHETDRTPTFLDGNFYNKDDGRKIVAPEELQFHDPHQAPNFESKIAEWESQLPLYGEVSFKAYESYDKAYKYIMANDKEGRAWIAAIENGSKVMSTGVRSRWTVGGDLLMPLYEYRQQSGGYGNATDSKGSYVQMWDYYLSKSPTLQCYKIYLRSEQAS